MFGATRHRVYVGCQTWSTDFFGVNHREVARGNPYYHSYYNKYSREILALLAHKGWIEEPSFFASLVNRIPLWDL